MKYIKAFCIAVTTLSAIKVTMYYERLMGTLRPFALADARFDRKDSRKKEKANEIPYKYANQFN
ncbi:hypothetical protein AC626_09515 [Pseudoalteromonas rubra]|uniref:Uncharacterized protein n=1 Tax=Pseudoalteromonas rubra TaxID=43658 RepID=A0A0L0EUS9_9GAMM|nr:hypothetical protein AC626_09515 [Pseudoalteromonas rubra]